MAERLFLILILIYFANAVIFLFLGHLITAKANKLPFVFQRFCDMLHHETLGKLKTKEKYKTGGSMDS